MSVSLMLTMQDQLNARAGWCEWTRSRSPLELDSFVEKRPNVKKPLGQGLLLLRCTVVKQAETSLKIGFFDVVLETVAAESPETIRRITKRLNTLQTNSANSLYFSGTDRFWRHQA